MSLRTLIHSVRGRSRGPGFAAETELIAQCMEELIDERNEDAIYRNLCDYARQFSHSLAVMLIVTTEENRVYEVRTLSCAEERLADALAERLPMKPHCRYDIDQIRALARMVDGHGRMTEYASLEAFVDSPRVGSGVKRVPGLGAVRRVIVYPLVQERSVKGALVLLSAHRRVKAAAYRVFAVQCSLVLKHMVQIHKLEEMRKLQEQLAQAQKMEAVGQLAGGIAHDFNNMLAGISGYAYLIRRKYGVTEPELKSFVDAIIAASKRASDLTTKLLAFARKGKYQTVAVDIHSTVREVGALLERTLDRRIQILEEFHASHPTVLGDPTQLQNLVLNLAINARDAMPAGGKLVFRTESRHVPGGPSKDGRYEIKEGRYLILSVIDTGLGMDEQTRKRLFEPFFTTKEVGKGTGLGLASVYGTVKGHGGFITVDSEVGKGSTFTVYLPQAEIEPPPETPPKTQALVRGRGRILVVDDEEMVRNLSREILTFLGYTVDTCKDGEDAVQFYKLHSRDIDLVLLDVIMPRMDGYETFRELQKIRPDVKVIITTGYSLKEDTQQILSRGICGFIQKPFESGPLSQIIHDVLAGKAPVVRKGKG